ncbi:hypothetical protein [Clostridium perfringens]|uniref:hypothetical protein n=1 Tax=Clostridium perfringens TaxID=1502 RepID=UPI001E5DE078|nr:hypothetical protein [Clostridium perfringens]MCC5432707.1 hypothetical protein [Clostridium perfringens]MCC5435493.1 hypothetical protein [Clostridium perfringens]MCC5444661.1 hypothetical protein [Clostridium perfringens]MCC5448314.1 hypothetical protein [Clostridium perfringens]MDK0596194.1 hypothetical protein [Clostridium perfringens]
MKKFFIGILLISSIAFIGCNEGENIDNKSNESTPVEQQANDENEKTLNLEEIKTPDDVNNAYKANLDKIKNGEKLITLNMKEITKDVVLDYANKAGEIANQAESSSDKIDTVEKLVSLHDLKNNTSQDVMEEVLGYIISEYESNQFNDESKLYQNLYITRYLDKRLDNHKNLSKADSMVSDMNQIIKDRIREDKSRIEANIEQVNKNINSVKHQIE